MTNEKIVSVVCEEYKIDKATLGGKSRVRKLVNARKIVALLIRNYNPRMSLHEIAESFAVDDARDHTTIINLLKKGKDHLETESDFRERYKNCMATLTNMTNFTSLSYLPK